MIRVRNPVINFEIKMAGQNPYYNLEITVIDKEYKRARARAMVRVLNINERPSAPSRTVFIPENTISTYFEPVVGFDVDAEHNHMSSNADMRLNYKLVADASENGGRQYGNKMFSIGKEDGQIQMLKTVEQWPGCSPTAADVNFFKAEYGTGDWLGRKKCKAICDQWLPANANTENEQSQLVKLQKDDTVIKLNIASSNIRVGQRVSVSNTGINPASVIQVDTFVTAVDGLDVSISKPAIYACTTAGGCDAHVRFHGCRKEVECQTYCVMDDRNVWKNRLDYETSGSITLVVRVTDADGAHSGPEGNMGEAFQHKDYDARITIILENSNERPIYYGTVRSVDENSGTWTPVGAPVPAIDEDESDTLTYWVDESMGMSVYGGDWLSTNSFFNDMKCFDIHPLYAQIIVANPILDYEIHGAIRIVVRAEDNSGFSDSAYVTITINNVNEGPRWIGGERGYSEEKCPAGWQLLDTTTCCEQSTGCTVCMCNQRR